MERTDALYKAFLEEMAALEDFRMTYAAAHPSVPLERDDPDVRRLLESLAFFSARTRLAGQRHLAATEYRLFQQFFPYLLTPLPSHAMLHAVPTGQFAETVVLPRDTEIAVSAPRAGTAIFRTLRAAPLRPLRLARVDTLALPGSGFRLALPFQAPYPRSEDVGRLSLHVNHLNDYHASLRLLHLLKRHVRAAHVVFDGKVDETTRGTPCALSYGLVPGDADEPSWSHPLQEERAFFHFPQQELFLDVEVSSTPRNWSQFTLCLDLDGDWPRNVKLNDSMFQPNVVPMRNLVRAFAEPLSCDGTRERHPLRHHDLANGFALHSVLGVYRVEPGGMVPLRAGILSGGSGSYEIERERGREGAERALLTVNLPEAFENPQTVTVEALWYQPWFTEALGRQLTVAPYRRSVTGVEWELLGAAVPHAEGRFDDELEAFLNLLTLKGKARLDLGDLRGLLQALGSVWHDQFRKLKDLVVDLRVEEVPLPQGSSRGLEKFVYRLGLREMEPVLEPLVRTFTEHLGRVLDGWCSEATVEVTTGAAAVPVASREGGARPR